MMHYEKTVKAVTFYFLIFFAIFQAIWWTLYFFLPEVTGLYQAVFSGALSGLLAPLFNKVNTESGEKIRVKWIFYRKPKFIG